MSFGESLSKDQLPSLNKHLVAGVQFLSEFREFVKERAQLEKEYSNKLESLVKKYQQRKAFGLSGLAPNHDPFSPSHHQRSNSDVGSLAGTITSTVPPSDGLGIDPEQSTLIRALSSLLDQTERIANDRAVFSEYLLSDIADPLKLVSQKSDESRKKNLAFSKKMTEERDKFYTEKDKAKSRYDESCLEVQSSRSKQEKTVDSKVMEKLQKQYFQEVIDRNNNKNLYVLSIAVANRHKEKHYNQDIPGFLNNLQLLNESWIENMKGFWSQYIELEMNCLNDSKDHLESIAEAVSLIDKKSESALFISCHPSQWSLPGDFEFLSYADFSEDDTLIDEEASKIFLFNKMSKAQSSLQSLDSELSTKEKELDGLYNLFNAYLDNPDTGDSDEVRENLFEVWRDLVIVKNYQLTNQTEVDVISQSLGENFVEGAHHDFKPASFTIPTTCDYCDSTIWGLSRHGATCKECGFNCHAKCELKVPPNCTLTKGGAKTNKKPTMNYSTLAAKTAPFLKNSPVPSSRQPIPSSFTDQPEAPSAPTPNPPPTSLPPSDQSSYLVLYDYDARDSSELSVQEGHYVQIIEPDDGSGWVTASLGGHTGLVPAAYIDLDATEVATVPPTEAAYPQAQALYDFDAQTEVELTIRAGDIVEVTDQNVADGWWEGTLNGQTGQFPANYVQLI